MLQAISEMAAVIVAIEKRDKDLGNQIRRAAASVVLNLGESCASRDGNRALRRRTSLGSLYEVQSAIATAVAFTYVEAESCRELRWELDRIASMLEALVRV